jgi:tRNA G18 (ribose-2'-O)-methylase SpoU
VPPTLNVVPVDSRDDPRLADYRDLKDAQLRALAGGSGYPADGLFIAEGDLVVRQLAASGLGVRSVFITPNRLGAMGDAMAEFPPGTPIYLAEPPVLNAVVGFNIHRGVLAAGERPPAPDLRQMLGSVRSLVVLEDLANHDNVGGIFRAVGALGGLGRAGVLISPRCCDPFYRKAIRVSMGMALRVPSARLEPWPEGLAALKEAGFTLLALTPRPGAAPIDALESIAKPALLLGAEGPGLSEAAMAAADRLVRIPIARGVDSLNVVVAAGIALHRLCAPEG